MNKISLIYYLPPKQVQNMWFSDFEGAIILAVAGLETAIPPVGFYFLLTVRVRRSFFPPPPRVRFEGPFTGSDFEGPFGIRAGKWVIQGIGTEMMVKEGSQVGPMSNRGIQVGGGSMKGCPKWDEKVKFFSATAEGRS
jgi:hypothetical protein